VKGSSGMMMRSNNKISFFEIVCIESQREYIEIVNYQEGIIINHAGVQYCNSSRQFSYYSHTSTMLQPGFNYRTGISLQDV
jgi:hypothetical protein